MTTMLDVPQLVALRDDIRRTEGGGGQCGIVSECIAIKYGYHEDGGCYIMPDGRHIAHMWNRLNTEMILDVTADQFGEGDNVRVTYVGDPRYSSCGCGKDG